MRYVGAALLLALAACSSSTDVVEPEPIEPTGVASSKQYLVVSGYDGEGGQVLGLTEYGFPEAATPEPTYWSFDDETDVSTGDMIIIIDSSGICLESYPGQCSARTAEVVTEAGDVGLVTYLTDERDRSVRTEAQFAPFIGAVVVNTGEPFAGEEVDPFTNVTIIDTDGTDLVGNPDLPSIDTPIILATTDDRAEELAQILFDQGYLVVINFHD